MARRLGQADRARFAEGRAKALAASLSYLTMHVPMASRADGLVVTLDDKPVLEVLLWG
jgi:hypothetical protein